MADRTPLKVAGHSDIADDDPFAELTRIMGFDPRQPVRQPTPAVEKGTPADQAAEENDFDIDLEKELMGDFDSAEESAPVPQQAIVHQISKEPTFEAAGVAANDDELTASFEQDFVFDDAADHADFAVARAPEPDFAPAPQPSPEPEFASEPEVAFDDDFDKAIASSLDVSAPEDDLAIDQEMAASLDQDFQLDDDEPADLEYREPAAARQDAVEAVQAASEEAFDADFDNAVQMSLEDELSFETHKPEQHAQAVEPVEAYATDPMISEDDFAGHADQAATDADMDIGEDMDHGKDQDFHEPELSLEDERAPMVEAPVETAHFAAEPEFVAPEYAAALSLEDDFELSFRDALNEEPQAPAVEPAAASQPTVAEPAPVVAAPVPPVAAVEPVKPAASERSLEDELNALLGAMTARPMPTVKEPVPAPRLVAQSDSYPSEKPAADDLDWDLDENQVAQNGQDIQPIESGLDGLLAGELDHQDFAVSPKTESSRTESGKTVSAKTESGIEFDDDAFGAAFAKSIEAEQAAARAKSEASSSDWLHSQSTGPAKSWSRSTPTSAPAVQASFAAQPAPSAPAQMAAPAYRSEPAIDHSAYAKPAQTTPPEPRQQDDMPDVETVDVPERVVALADDLDIPELSFEEDQPSAAAYDDLDAEFATLLTDMNATEIASAPVQNRGYDDESYRGGFNGYDRRDLRAEAPAAPVAPASFAAANGYDADDLPGSRPVSQADAFATDELDYDPELEEAMAIPGLAEREAAQPRRRGTTMAALVGAVVVLGGLGALAFSFGGKGGSEAPVIVKADNSPIKVKPENPGGTVVPNQDNKVYDAVAKGGGATKPTEPVQQKLVNTTEQPVDLASKEPQQSRVVDLSPGNTDAAAGADTADNPGSALPGVAQAAAPESAQPAAPASAQPAASAPKSEDRIAQVLQQDADNGANNDVVAVAPRKVKTMMVKPDGSLVPREDPAPVAPKVAAAEPSDPAPQHVAPTSDGQQTGTLASDADQADAATVKPVKPAKKTEAKAQSADTPATVPVAPARPSDQPVDIVGEVKPDQVASIDPAAAAGSGSWSMQIASQPTVESAQSTYQDLQRRYASVLSGRTASIVKAEVAGKGTFYRVRVPAKSRNDAIALCTSYKAAGGNCFVSR
ncbi:Sporulation related domain-containing protein [Mesorhizobium sp. NFR06]|uniref:SPOR domain-containing protein n=1 Tax=Mesorhizobium sp. NFR06 TaxID=1566290 RepID=UPI0008ED9B4C|nr:SPOR domain-containing protein [Mesorhizobium sp. NFR06]SFO87339.1 Sporulation related domain-containing protein [Mesorhizobium sp. NFR06]